MTKGRKDWREDFDLQVQVMTDGLRAAGHADLTLDKRRSNAIAFWLRHGDLRPLASAIEEGWPVDSFVGRQLMGLIAEGRLKVSPGRSGAPSPPSNLSRRARMYMAYKDRRASLNSEDAFTAVAADFGIDEKTVRSAVTKTGKLLRS
jgi:hypothetical protein